MCSPSADTVLNCGDMLILVASALCWRGFQTYKKKKPALNGLLLNYPGDDLLSHTVPRVVPLALKGLTTVFGKGTGVAPSLEPPKIFLLLR